MVIGAWPRSSATTIRPRLVSIATGNEVFLGRGRVRGAGAAVWANGGAAKAASRAAARNWCFMAERIAKRCMNTASG